MKFKKLPAKKMGNYIPFLIIVMALFAAGLILAHPGINRPETTKVVECNGEKNTDFSCWSEYYTAIVTNSTTKAAFADLRERYVNNTYLSSQCHQITHVIGRAELAKGTSVGVAYQQGDSLCWSGYYHGVVEQVAKKMGKADFVSQLNTICSDVEASQRYSFNHYNCVHGLGHGVMTISDNELFDSLSYCDTVTDSWNRSSCFGGVFMENIMSDPSTNPTHATKYLKTDKPMYPCTDVGYQYKEQCYLMQTSYALKLVGYDFAKTFVLCSEIEEIFQNTCYQSLGRDASGNSVSNVVDTKKNCQLGTNERQRTNCAIGAVKDFISYYSDDTKAKELCLSFDDAAVQATCSTTATEYYRSF